MLPPFLLNISFFSPAPENSDLGWCPPPSLPSHIPTAPSNPCVSQHPPENVTVGLTVPKPEGRELVQAGGFAKPWKEVSLSWGRAAIPGPSLPCTDVRARQSPHQRNLCLPKGKPLQGWDVSSPALITAQTLPSSPRRRQSRGHALPAFPLSAKGQSEKKTAK